MANLSYVLRNSRRGLPRMAGRLRVAPVGVHRAVVTALLLAPILCSLYVLHTLQARHALVALLLQQQHYSKHPRDEWGSPSKPSSSAASTSGTTSARGSSVWDSADAYGPVDDELYPVSYASSSTASGFGGARASGGAHYSSYRPVLSWLASFSALLTRAQKYLTAPDPAQLWNPALLRRLTLGKREQLCHTFNSPEVSCIAIVGNGPISEEQRHEIARCQRVVRFNAVNNRVAGDPVTVWAVRYNYHYPYWYWGFTQLAQAQTGEASELLAQAPAVLFLGGPPLAVAELMDLFPSLRRKRLLQVDIRDYQAVYEAVFKEADSRADLPADPSSGLLGLLVVAGCAPRRTPVHIFGFNWSSKAYYAHMLGAEALLVERLVQAHPNLHVHPTACAGYRSCETLCDGEKYRRAKDGDASECVQRKQAEAAARDAAAAARAAEEEGQWARQERDWALQGTGQRAGGWGPGELGDPVAARGSSADYEPGDDDDNILALSGSHAAVGQAAERRQTGGSTQGAAHSGRGHSGEREARADSVSGQVSAAQMQQQPQPARDASQLRGSAASDLASAAQDFEEEQLGDIAADANGAAGDAEDEMAGDLDFEAEQDASNGGAAAAASKRSRQALTVSNVHTSRRVNGPLGRQI